MAPESVQVRLIRWKVREILYGHDASSRDRYEVLTQFDPACLEGSDVDLLYIPNMRTAH